MVEMIEIVLSVDSIQQNPIKLGVLIVKNQYLKIEFQLDVQTVQIRIIPLVVVLQSTSLMN